MRSEPSPTLHPVSALPFTTALLANTVPGSHPRGLGDRNIISISPFIPPQKIPMVFLLLPWLFQREVSFCTVNCLLFYLSSRTRHPSLLLNLEHRVPPFGPGDIPFLVLDTIFVLFLFTWTAKVLLFKTY